ncbi:unnamed protein product [Periconia digitata]|uniref:DJ-1/PfpI domain-containing protein n=1 Tax=Periconia digitata TaxID=1303443 RepID=A0A9W4UK35_9PLEO|nr:unnamed protein product [Periconia digitata]
MSTFTLSNPNRTIHAGVILLGHMEVLDVAPIDLLHNMGKRFMEMLPVSEDIKAKAYDIETHWVTEKGAPARLSANMTLQATDSFDSCPRLDIVLIGAWLPSYTPNEAELAFIRKSHEDCSAFLTICGGFTAAQMTGLLDGKMATAPRFMIPMLKEQHPRTTWVDKRVVRDGKIWTSGALLNGLDLMREFVKETWPEIASVVVPLGGWPVRGLEYHGTDGMPVPMEF